MIAASSPNRTYIVYLTLLLGFIRRLTGAPLFGHVAAPTGPST